MTEVSSHDIESLLFTTDRYFLVRNNGDQVKMDCLRGKKIGLYFSASWFGPCRKFTPSLIEVYNELCPKGDFEIIFISADEDVESFSGYFSKMPWLAIPFSDSETHDNLDELFKVRDNIPDLVILDENGKVIWDGGVDFIREYRVEGYPFTPERIKELKEQEEEARKEPSLKSLLDYGSRDFVISNDGKKVPVSELEGTIVGLYFSDYSYKPCLDFTPKLVEAYEKIKAKGENFEIVLIPLDGDDEDDDDDDELFRQAFVKVPWLSLPFKEICEKLTRYFDPVTIPALVIVGKDGKILHSNVAEAIEDHGFMAYPFTPERLEELEKAKEQEQTLESILVAGDRDFVIGKDGTKIPVSDLVGKSILLYFTARYSPPCETFLPKLAEAYHKIKANNDAFEVIYISFDYDQTSFDEFFSGMPWLALPFGNDGRGASLSSKLKVRGIPMLIAVGQNGRTVTKTVRELIEIHGADAYPFTDERLKEIEAQQEEMTMEWPEKVKHTLHEHELVRTRPRKYKCYACKEVGYFWSFFCVECDFYLHPKCALEEDNGTKNEANREHNTS